MAITQTPGPEMLSLKQQTGEEDLHTSFYTVHLGVNMKMSNLFFCHLAKLIICLSTRRYILFSYWHKVLFAQIYILLNVCTYLFLSEHFCK